MIEKYLFLGETSVYNRDVITLFKLSSKSAIITESNFTFPIVYLFSSFSLDSHRVRPKL